MTGHRDSGIKKIGKKIRKRIRKIKPERSSER